MNSKDSKSGTSYFGAQGTSNHEQNIMPCNQIMENVI